jgi:hypothetical protein
MAQKSRRLPKVALATFLLDELPVEDKSVFTEE